MKLSISIPDNDVDFLDLYAEKAGIGSRSAVVHQAIDMLRSAELADDYTSAFAEWSASGNAQEWDTAAGDGLTR